MLYCLHNYNASGLINTENVSHGHSQQVYVIMLVVLMFGTSRTQEPRPQNRDVAVV